MFPKIVLSPNHPLNNRVFHYFHHPFRGKITYCWKHPTFGTGNILGDSWGFWRFLQLAPCQGPSSWLLSRSSLDRRFGFYGGDAFYPGKIFKVKKTRTLPETNSLPLKDDGWKMKFPIEIVPFFGGHVSFRGCMFFSCVSLWTAKKKVGPKKRPSQHSSPSLIKFRRSGENTSKSMGYG